MSISSLCDFVNINPLDENGPEYDPPIILIDSTSINNGDTVSYDTATIVLLGNRSQSLFRIQINNKNWSDWNIEGPFSIKNLTEGTCLIRISTMYRGGERIFYDSLVFFVDFKDITNNDTIKIDTLDTNTIIATIVTDTTDTNTVIDTVKDTTYKVIYKGNGNDSGSIPIDTNSYHSGTIVTVLSGIDLVKKDHEFSGWSTISSDGLTIYIPGETFEIDKTNVVLSAQWVAKSIFSLSYNGNGNTGGFLPETTSHIEGTYVKVSSEISTLSKTGHKFLCWNTNSIPNNGIDYTPGSTILIRENTILYARWEKNKYKLEYRCTTKDAGEIPIGGIFEYDSNIIIADNSLIRTGFSFKNWNDKSDGTGKSYSPGNAIKMEDDSLILYAQWNNPQGMVLIPSKNLTFSMGSVVPVKLTKNFWFDTTEITQKIFDSLMSVTYSPIYQKPIWNAGIGDNYPAYNISWYVAALYCNARTKMTGSTDTVYTYKEIEGDFLNCNLNQLSIDYSKKGFRLPTDAEYEFAARGGSSIVQYSSEQLNEIAWYFDNSNGSPHQVAQKKENGYGLHDILGNLYEWSNELYYSYPNNSELLIDPKNEAQIDPRQDNNKWTYRGGSWDDDLDRVICTFRYFKMSGNGDTFTGFRSCLPIQE